MSVEERAEYQRVGRTLLYARDKSAFDVLDEEAVCRGCGCSNSLGCWEGCWWAIDDGFLLCSSCDAELAEDSPLREPFPFFIPVPADAGLSKLVEMLNQLGGRGWALSASITDSVFLARWPHQNGFTLVAVLDIESA